MMSFRNGTGDGPAIGTVEIAAAALALLWLVAVAGVVFGGALSGQDGGGAFAALAGVMAVVMPVAVIGMVVATARQIRMLRAEAEMLRAELLRLQAGAPLRPAAEDASQAGGPMAFDMGHENMAWAEEEPDEPAAEEEEEAPAPDDEDPPFAAPEPVAERAPPAPPRANAERADRAERAERAEPRPAPPLAAPAPQPPAEPLSIDSYITALNFPDSADDVDGIRALHEALSDEPTAKLIRAAQDVLTLLADDGVFMDDVPVDPASATAWRRLARDGRGTALGPMGALISPQVFERVAARMAGDQVFHDAAHHFLRQFDRSLAALAEVGGDADLAALGDTRTARAFLLLARVSNSME